MRKALTLLAIGVSLLAGSADAVTTDTDELVEFLIQRGVLTTQDAASFRANLALMRLEEAKKPKKDFTVVGKTPISASGYLQLQYNATRGYNVYDEAKIRRARMTLSGDINPKVAYKFQIDAVQPLKSMTESVTSVTGDGNDNTKPHTVSTKTSKVVTRPILLDAQIDYRPFSYVKMTVGQFKLPFGRENLESSPRLESIERSQMTEKLAPGRDIGSQGRDIGAMASGQLAFAEGKYTVDYASGVFNGAGINVGEDNYWKDTCERLIVTLWRRFSLGGSQYDGMFWAKKGTRNLKTAKMRTGGEASIIWDPFTLKGEYVAVNDTLKGEGWYAQGTWRGLKKPLDLEAVVKYEAYNPNLSKEADDVRTDISTLGLNWYLSKSSRIQVNYQFRKDPEIQVKRDDTLLAQFQVQF